MCLFVRWLFEKLSYRESIDPGRLSAILRDTTNGSRILLEKQINRSNECKGFSILTDFDPEAGEVDCGDLELPAARQQGRMCLDLQCNLFRSWRHHLCGRRADGWWRHAVVGGPTQRNQPSKGVSARCAERDRAPG